MTEPLHPGQILSRYLTERDWSRREAAKNIGMSRQSLSYLLNCHIRVNANVALKLEKAFDLTAEEWLIHQNTYDLHKLRNATNENKTDSN